MVITSKEPEKVLRAESWLTVSEDENKIDKWYREEKETKIEWFFQQKSDESYVSRVFMNSIGFEYVQQI